MMMKGVIPQAFVAIALLLFISFLFSQPAGIYPAVGTLNAGQCVMFENDRWQITGAKGSGTVEIMNLRTNVKTFATSTDENSFAPTSCTVVSGGFAEDTERLYAHYGKTKSSFDFPEDCPVVGLAVTNCIGISGVKPTGMSINFQSTEKSPLTGNPFTISFSNYYYEVDASGHTERAGINTGVYADSQKFLPVAKWDSSVSTVATPTLTPAAPGTISSDAAGRIPFISDIIDALIWLFIAIPILPP